jgi:hypothetical protein
LEEPGKCHNKDIGLLLEVENFHLVDVLGYDSFGHAFDGLRLFALLGGV